MKYIVIILALALGACTTTMPTTITKEIATVVKPPNNLYKCPQLTMADFPNPDTATNLEISKILTKLYKYNKVCGQSLQGIKRYIAAAEKRIKEG